MSFEWVDKVFEEALPLILKSGSSKTQKYVKTLDLFKNGRKKYFSAIKHQLGYIQILGMEQPIKIDKLYVKVGFSSQIQSRSYANFKSLISMSNEEYRKKRVRKTIYSNSDLNLKYGAEIIRSDSHLVVLGKPGSGKTTFLKYLALYYAGLLKNQPSDLLFPFFISLRELADSGKKPIDFILDKMIETGFVEANTFFNKVIAHFQHPKLHLFYSF